MRTKQVVVTVPNGPVVAVSVTLLGAWIVGVFALVELTARILE